MDVVIGLSSRRGYEHQAIPLIGTAVTLSAHGRAAKRLAEVNARDFSRYWPKPCHRSKSGMTQIVDLATDHLPLWVIGVVLVLVFLGACEIGFLVTRRVYRSRELTDRDRGSLGYIVTAIFALLAFMLATTFSMALTRFDTRRMALANEVDAIGTAYLRASLLDEPYATRLRLLLRQYAHCRTSQPKMSREQMELRIEQCRAIGDQLWETTRVAVQPVRTTALASYMVSAVNDVLNASVRRGIAGRAVIPGRVLSVLLICTIAASVALGSVLMGSTTRLRGASALLLALYAACFVLILDIDRTRSGTVAVSQRPMQQLAAELGRSAP
jgi:hypothetical protein